ncbi:DedA family protein [Bacillus sp. FJAT-47783]|uniref:DedA family protein n=1 Tax=Bacillus sp. FJAT-47783 TaxID=2922712 RepID=UPI001FABD5F6|nr:DedA family protein [Bacillus sp. FJAT-47783]
MESLFQAMLGWFKDLSYVGVMIALTFEFVPGEIVLPLVGYWVYKGEMSMFWAVIAGTIGGTTGPLTFYALGYFAGRPFLEKYGKYMFLSQKSLAKSEMFFEKHGAFVAFTGRFIPGVRTAISLPCGIAKMNVGTFTLYTFLAMIPITYLYIYLGYMLGGNVKQVQQFLNIWFFPFALLAFCLYLFIFFYRRNHQIRSITIQDFLKK